MGDGGRGGVLQESARLGASGVSAAHLRNPGSLSCPKHDGFVPEVELKSTNLYRKPSLSTYESERKRECGTGGVWSASCTSAKSRVRRACSPEREIFIDNLLVRVHLIIEMSRPALRRGSLNSLFQVALYLPS